MLPGYYAAKDPNKVAVTFAETGESVTFAALEQASVRLACALWAQGVRPGDHIAVDISNRREFFEAFFAGLRMGLFVVPINRFLSPTETAYIINDSDARILFMSDDLSETAAKLPDLTPKIDRRIMFGAPCAGYESADAFVASGANTTLPDKLPLGDFMFYTSGSTGHPKGVKAAPHGRLAEEGLWWASYLSQRLGFGEDSTFLTPAPLYHSGPAAWSFSALGAGSKLIVMKKFDPEYALSLIDQYQITHAYVVPTMFVRMLKLPEETRKRYSLKSLKGVIHQAAPISIEVKRQMIEWWGPVLYDQYGGSESDSTWLTPQEWLERPGTSGRADQCVIHIVREDGSEADVGEVGQIYFESAGAALASYYKAPEKTRDAHNDKGWLTIGDMGHLDADGYLFLAERQDFMILSGGVNIYPTEIEHALIAHPDVNDAAVFGLPEPEMGERVVAVVAPRPGVAGDDALRARLDEHCRSTIAPYKRPRLFYFEDELPRLPTGKLYKKPLREKYLAMQRAAESRGGSR